MAVVAPVSRSAKKETTANLRKVLLKAYYILFGWETHEENEECVEAFVEKTFIFDENLLLAQVFLGKADADVRTTALLTQAVTKRKNSAEGSLLLKRSKLVDFVEVFDARLLSEQRSWPKSAKIQLLALRDYFQATAAVQPSAATLRPKIVEQSSHPAIKEAPRPKAADAYPTIRRNKPLELSERLTKLSSEKVDVEQGNINKRSLSEQTQLACKRVECLKASYGHCPIAVSIAFERDSAIYFLAKESGIEIAQLTNAFSGLTELTEQQVLSLPAWCNQSLRLCLMQA